MKKSTSLFLVLLMSIATYAQIDLVKDINSTKEIVSSDPGEYDGFFKAGNWLYFEAETEVGLSLWKTDGTPTGTQLVKDITTTDGYGTQIEFLSDFFGKLLFLANDNIHGKELWISDGTPAGTKMVKDINAGADDTGIEPMGILNNQFYFFAYTSAIGNEIWKTDGTDAGTVPVKDIFPGSLGSLNASYLSVVILNGKFYFNALDGVTGFELWTSDGTASGTTLVKDIVPGVAASNPDLLTVLNDNLIFVAGETSNRELYISDGTSSGTSLLEEINSSGSAQPAHFYVYNDRLYFSATSSKGNDPWISDGTPGGTKRLKDVKPGNGSSSPFGFIGAGNTLYFSADDGIHGIEIWKSDGTEAGTQLLKDIYPGSGDAANENGRIDFNGSLVFVAQDPVNGKELWKTDGTEAGTSLLKDMFPGTGSSLPYGFSLIANKLYFGAKYNSKDTEPWISDGTTDGTFQLANLNLAGPSVPGDFLSINDKVVFVATTSTAGRELFKTNGTTAGTKLLKDIFKTADTESSSPAMLTEFNNLSYFFASSGGSSNQLWKSNGKNAGTQMIYDFGAGSKSKYGPMVVYNEELYFSAASSSTNGIPQLWKSDGTTAGTVTVYDDFVGEFIYAISDLKVVGNTLFFAATGESNNKELWKSDGTTIGTQMVKDIYSGGPSSPSHLFDFNGVCYFKALDNSHLDELWRSDGTDVGTYLVKDIEPGSLYSSNIDNFIVSPSNPNLFYFTAFTVANGRELYKSDGTALGTEIVKDIYPGFGNASPYDLTAFKGKIYFFANDNQAAGNALWKTDGTSGGTVLVKDIYAGVLSGFTNYLTPYNGYLYFAGQDATTSHAIWKTDGTSSGTELVIDINAKDPITNLFVGGEFLFFSANVNNTGEELYQTDGTQVGTFLVEDQNPGKEFFSPENFLFGNGTLMMTGKTEQYGNEVYVYTPQLRLSDEEIKEQGSVLIYPNPASEILNIKNEKLNSGTLTITNLLGKTMLVQSFISTEISIDVSFLTPGTYLMRLQSEEGTLTRAFVKQ